MEVQFIKLTVRNFLAVRDQVVWPLDNQGLVAILGVNRDSSAADSNGAGKSTLFEALVWCLWGRTVRGLTADEVINRIVGKDCCVQVEFTHNGVDYMVARYRKDPKLKNDLHFFSMPQGGTMESLTQQTIVDTQTKIDEVLGIDFDTFIRGPMMPQGSFKRFSQLTDAEAKAILEGALQMDTLARAGTIAKERAAALTIKLDAAETELQMLVSLLERVNRDLADYAGRERNFAAEKELRIKGINRERAPLEKMRDELLMTLMQPSVLQEAVQKAQEAGQKVQDLSGRLQEQWLEKERAARNEVGERTTAWKTASYSWEQLESRYSRIKKLEGACPVCERPITKAHQKQVLKMIEPELRKLEAAVREADAKVLEADEQRKQVEQGSREAARRIGDMRNQAITKIRAAEEALRENERTKQEIERLEQQIMALLQQIRIYAQEDSPYLPVIDKFTTEQQELGASLRRLKPKMEAHQLEINYLEFWRKGFGNQGLKSYILRAVTPYMNQRAAYYSQALTGGELTIEFTTQTQLKSGQVRDQFGVLVTNRNGAQTYQGNSGGEKSRADLVINLVLSDLVCTRAQKSYPQRFFDEPFENLDESGVDGVMGLLQDMAPKAGSIFVVTHQAGMAGQFGRVVQVVKENGKSTIEV